MRTHFFTPLPTPVRAEPVEAGALTLASFTHPLREGCPAPAMTRVNRTSDTPTQPSPWRGKALRTVL